MLVLWISALILLFLYIWNMWKFVYASFQIKGPVALPLIRNTLEFMGTTEDFLQTLTRLVKKYDTPFRVWGGSRFIVMLAKPEDIEIILNHPKSLQKAGFYKFFQPITGESIFSQEDIRKWRHCRKLLAPAFNQKILNSFVGIFEEHSLILCKKLEKMVKKGEFNVYPFTRLCNLDLIFETAIGAKVNFQLTDNHDYGNWIDNAAACAFARTFNVWQHFDFIYKRTKAGKEFMKCRQCLLDFNDKIIQEKLEQYIEKQKYDAFFECERFLDICIKALEEERHITKKQIKDEVATFIAAGSHSSSGTTAFTMMMLGMHPEIQNKVYEELCDIFGDTGRSMTNEDVAKMKYLERVIKETLRLFPFTIVGARITSEDITLNHCTIPKDSDCVILTFHTQRDPKIWPNPLQFNPDRFLPEELSKRHPYSWIPFSGGPRNCIGLKHAMLSMKVLLSTVVRKYKIYCKYQSVEEIRVKPDFALTPIDGYPISLELRN